MINNVAIIGMIICSSVGLGVGLYIIIDSIKKHLMSVGIPLGIICIIVGFMSIPLLSRYLVKS